MSIEAIEIGGEVGFFKMLDDQKRANHVLYSLLSKISRGCLDLGYHLKTESHIKFTPCFDSNYFSQISW